MTPFLGGSFRELPISECRSALAELMAGTWRAPERIRRSFGRISDTQALTKIESLCDDFFMRGRLAIISGVPDGGKTFAAFALAGLGYLRHGMVWQWFQAQAFFKMAWDDKTRADYNDAWIRPATLILDDLGAESETRTSTLEANLYDGLNLRYAEQLPTILTTNLPLEVLLAKYGDFGERLNSRIAEWGGLVEITVATGLRELGDASPAPHFAAPAGAGRAKMPDVGISTAGPIQARSEPENARFAFELGDEEKAALSRERAMLWVEQEGRDDEGQNLSSSESDESCCEVCGDAICAGSERIICGNCLSDALDMEGEPDA